MISFIRNKITEISNTCKKHHVEKLSLFGSAVREDFKQNESDIDLLVTFKSELDVLDFAENYFSLVDSLQNIFNHEVDLVVERSLKNKILIAEINKYRQELYAT